MNKLKAKAERVLLIIAGLFIRSGVSPNEITVFSLVLSLIGYIVVIYTRSGLYLALFILLSGFLDALDGVVARARSMTTRKGAFLDSFIDRVCEVVYSASFIELGFDPRLVLVFASGSLLISYARARGESLGVELMGVGLMERAERLLILGLTGVIYCFDPVVALYVYAVAAVLVSITVIQRFLYLWSRL